MKDFEIINQFQIHEKFGFGSIYIHHEYNIVLIYYAEKAVIRATEARKISQSCQSIADLSQPVFAIILAEVSSVVEKDARDFFGNDPFNQNQVKATAVVIKSLAHRITYNIYLKFNKPASILKAFKSDKNALSWLLKNGANRNR